MRGRVISVVWRMGIAFAAIATATLLSIILWKFHVEALPRIAPFLFLSAVLICSWVGGYVSGITAVFSAHLVGNQLLRRDPTQIDPYRLALTILLSVAVSWIEAHRRQVESELRARVQEKTAQLTAAVANLEREVRERRVGEEEILRLNRLLELRVDERTRQLEVSNQELESFSYSVSHDLRAPLRSIDGFSRILLATCPSKFNDEERGLFQRILAATGRMNELIDDLLNLARVTRTNMRAEMVDLSALATRIAAELRHDHPESATEFVIQPGLTAVCDVGLVDVVVRNLLENGWKFSSHSPLPRVEFGSTSASGETVLFVRDNGAGFDPAYQSKLFAPFQRLHRQEEFPGSGIGLATVSRIVHRHGGWIKAESQLGKGATFFFTLCAARALHRPDDPKPPVPRSEAPSASSTHSTWA